MNKPIVNNMIGNDLVPLQTGAGGTPFGELLSGNRWVQVLEIAAVFLPPLLLVIAFHVIGGDSPLLFMGGLWGANILMIGLVWLGIRLRGDSWSSIGLSLVPASIPGLGWAVLKSIPVFAFAVGAFIFASIIMANIVGIPEGINTSNLGFLQGNLPLLMVSLVGVYIVSSFGEEVVYRGFLITRLEKIFAGRGKLTLIAALTVSSLVFGFAHYAWGAMGIAQTSFMGAALGISFIFLKRRLWPLILCHGYMDTALLVQLYLAP